MIYNIVETKAKVQTFTNAKVNLFSTGKAIIFGKHRSELEPDKFLIVSGAESVLEANDVIVKIAELLKTFGYDTTEKPTIAYERMIKTYRINKPINLEKCREDYGAAYGDGAKNQSRVYLEIDKKKIGICHTGVFQLFVNNDEERTPILRKLVPILNECLKNK